MVQSELSAYSGSDPIWGFVALVGSELFTGEAAVGLDPRVRLFAVEGRIYFAEREDDAPVATRLVNCGAISAMQLARGTVQAGGQESLARLFQRDVTVDRDAVELTIATSTESLLASIAHNPVGMPEVFPLRYHVSGIHHWLRRDQAIVGAEDVVADEAAPEVPVVEAPVTEAPITEVPVVETPVAEVPVAVEEMPVAEMPIPEVAVAETPEHQTLPVLETYPAPKLHAESAVPEWPRVDDEPAWAVPPDSIGLPNIAPPVAAEPVVASAVVPITAAHLPQLAPLSSIQIQPTPADSSQPVATEQFQPPSPVEPAAVEPTFVEPTLVEAAAQVMDAPLLPKLAAGPMSVNDLKKDLRMAAAAAEPWSGSTNNMAAVQIWEMVDDIFEDPKNESVRVGSGAPDERGRGWRRKKG